MKWLIAVALATACAHRAPLYRTGALGPEWQAVREKGAEVGWFNPALDAIIQANASCERADATSLESLTRQLLIGYTERRVISQERAMLDGREALHTVAEAKLDGVPMRFELYVLKRNGCVFDLSYAAPPARADGGRLDFHRFVAGFQDRRGRT
jgi:hypothetical protein